MRSASTHPPSDTSAQAALQSETLPYWKYHALGNDYIVLRQCDVGVLSPEAIERICNRHFGVGSDGILLDTQEHATAPISLRIFNPDGGEAEKSGNGLRIFSRFLWDAGRVGEDPFLAETLGGQVRCQVLDRGASVEVEMGRVLFAGEEIPCTAAAAEVLNCPLTLSDGMQVTISAASIGNPHCVVLTEQPTPALAQAQGPLIENHPAFPARTNVQFVKVISRSAITMEIWERGAGYTLASGSSASATVGVLNRLGLVDQQVTVTMPGGRLEVGVNDQFEITMRGSVTRVATGQLYQELFGFRA